MPGSSQHQAAALPALRDPVPLVRIVAAAEVEFPRALGQQAAHHPGGEHSAGRVLPRGLVMGQLQHRCDAALHRPILGGQRHAAAAQYAEAQHAGRRRFGRHRSVEARMGFRLLPAEGMHRLVGGERPRQPVRAAHQVEAHRRVALGATQAAADGLAQRPWPGRQVGCPVGSDRTRRLVPVAERVEPRRTPAGAAKSPEQAGPGRPVRIEPIEPHHAARDRPAPGGARRLGVGARGQQRLEQRGVGCREPGQPARCCRTTVAEQWQQPRAVRVQEQRRGIRRQRRCRHAAPPGPARLERCVLEQRLRQVLQPRHAARKKYQARPTHSCSAK